MSHNCETLTLAPLSSVLVSEFDYIPPYTGRAMPRLGPVDIVLRYDTGSVDVNKYNFLSFNTHAPHRATLSYVELPWHVDGTNPTTNEIFETIMSTKLSPLLQRQLPDVAISLATLVVDFHNYTCDLYDKLDFYPHYGFLHLVRARGLRLTGFSVAPISRLCLTSLQRSAQNYPPRLTHGLFANHEEYNDQFITDYLSHIPTHLTGVFCSLYDGEKVVPYSRNRVGKCL